MRNVPPVTRRYKPPTMIQVYQGEAKRLFNVISTFAGTGGSSTGYRLAGGYVLAMNEFIKEARDCYAENYPYTIIMPEDIRKLTGKEILERVGLDVGELDVLDGSPPCASFSMSGKREEHWGKEKKYSETKQRTDDLFFEFARILEEIQPRAFVGENVQGLTVGKAAAMLGDGQPDLFGESEDTIIGTLQNCGYRVAAKVINAKDYGVPQNRPRLIMIGVRKDLEISPTHPPVLTPRPYTLIEALTDLEQSEEDIQEAVIGKQYQVYKWLEQMEPGQAGSDVHPNGSYFNLKRLAWDEPVGTVCQSHGSPGIACSHMHPDEMRKLSIPELKRVSSFPDDFVLTGTFQQRWERIGRAVPPLMMKAIAEHVYNIALKEK